MGGFQKLARNVSATNRNKETHRLVQAAQGAPVSSSRAGGPGGKMLAGAAPDEAAFAPVREWYQDITPSQKGAVLAGLFAAGNFQALRALLNVTARADLDSSLLRMTGERFAENHQGFSVDGYVDAAFADPVLARQVVDNFFSHAKISPEDSARALFDDGHTTGFRAAFEAYNTAQAKVAEFV